MKLIVTRPLEDALSLAETLKARAHVPVIMPLIQIIARTGSAVPDLPWQAICVTSANAPRAIACKPSWSSCAVFAVGRQSAAAARQQGYHNVEAHGGDVDGLTRHMVAHLNPAAGPILYLSGAETSGDLEGKLKDHGFSVHREIIYDAVPVVPTGLADAVRTADGVLLYSPRSAKLWRKAVESANAVTGAASITHFCLSGNVAAQLPAEFSRQTAETPDESALLSLLDR